MTTPATPGESRADKVLDRYVDGMTAAAFSTPGGGMEQAANALFHFDDDEVPGDDDSADDALGGDS